MRGNYPPEFWPTFAINLVLFTMVAGVVLFNGLALIAMLSGQELLTVVAKTDILYLVTTAGVTVFAWHSARRETAVAIQNLPEENEG